MERSTKSAVAKRLARIEGQVRGVAQMVEQDRYCLDVVTQVRAARAALAKIDEIILADHLAHCVEAAIVSGDPARQREKVAELIHVFSKAER
jgi:DNA-binding FrmR family transcriptional regulator